MEQKELLFLKPVFRENIWGGDRLAFEFGYEIPGVHTGECLAAGAYPGYEIRVDRGTYEGVSLENLWKEHRELFGNYASGKFPLNVKLLDAQEDLSVQVHPDEVYAGANENGASGRTKFWYVLACEENQKMILGHYATDKAEFKKAVREKRFEDIFREIPIKKGDFFQIDPGCIHALKKGTMVYEVNEGSEIAYRIYDYDRMREGKKAELHTAQAIEVTRCPHEDPILTPKVQKLSHGTFTEYVNCPSYRVIRLELMDGGYDFKESDAFAVASVVEGSGTLDGVRIRKGNHFIIPYQYGSFRIEGNLELMISYPGNP